MMTLSKYTAEHEDTKKPVIWAKQQEIYQSHLVS